MKRSIVALFFAMLFLVTTSLSVYAEDPVIIPVELQNCTVTFSRTSYTFTGSEIKPKATVTYNGNTLVKGIDYTITYSNNVNAGNAKAVFTAVDGNVNYTGSVTKTFVIDKMNITLIKNQIISNTHYTYSGKSVKPNVLIYGDRYSPEKGTDYTLVYKNNVYTGIGTVYAKGTGNYQGTITKKFYIHPKTVTGLNRSNITSTSYKLSWNSVSGKITGYKIYRYNKDSKSYKPVAKTSKTSYTFTNMASGTAYKYVVKAYKSVSGKTIFSQNISKSKILTTKPAQVQTYNSSFKGKYFIVKWNKITCSGYQIQYSQDKNFKKGVKTISVSAKNSYRKIKISKDKTYYYRVRAFKKSDGKVYYGAYSVKKTTYFTNVYATYTTYFSSPDGRTTNIKLASKFINGTLLSPGETFSFNGTVGQRTPERGFKEAGVYVGQTHSVGYGGGVCQVSSTIFNAALLANLQIAERHQHSMKVTYVPSGRDAAISWGSQDMKFTNNTGFEIKISVKVYNNSQVEVKLLTNSIKNPSKVSLSVKQSGKNYTLKRYVSGKCNYTTYSTY